MNGFGTQFRKLSFWSLIHIIHMEWEKDCNLTIRYHCEGFQEITEHSLSYVTVKNGYSCII